MMSDKGREKIQAQLAKMIDSLTGYAPPEKDSEIATFMDWLFDDGILRSAGWVHRDDEVGRAKEVPICRMRGGMCSDRQPDKRCTINTFCDYQDSRPATIGDLIGE
jgi:hypothetical protein